MKQAPLTMMAFGLFFTARFSTARYLLVDIDDGAIGARVPVSRDGDGILDSFLNIYKLNVKLYIFCLNHSCADTLDFTLQIVSVMTDTMSLTIDMSEWEGHLH